MKSKIAVVIPCYKVSDQIMDVLGKIGPEVDMVYVVDDACPEQSGKLVKQRCLDNRVNVIFHQKNLGVGGAVKTGFLKAIAEGATILVKVDGDGQIDPANICSLIRPIQKEKADYVKGNRFFNHRGLKGMPLIRIFGNAVLSFLTKLSSGYWHIMDPTNGFVAIHAKVFSALESEKIDDRFFFETDMLFRLHLLGAVVQDIPLVAHYGDEKSNLKIGSAFFRFSIKHCVCLFKRTVYEYFIQDFNAGSTQLTAAILLMGVGFSMGLSCWLKGVLANKPTEPGVIMIVAIMLIIGFQLLLGALQYDVSNRHTTPVHPYL